MVKGLFFRMGKMMEKMAKFFWLPFEIYRESFSVPYISSTPFFLLFKDFLASGPM